MNVKHMYRVIQNETSIFLKAIVSVIVKKKVCERMSNSEWFEFPDLLPLDICLCDCVESEVYKRKMDTRD